MTSRTPLKLTALAVSAALTLSACSGGGEESGDGALSFATWQFLEPNRGEQILDALEGYTEENADVTIEPVEIARADYEKTLSTQFGAGDGPDIFVIPDAYFPQLSEAGLLEPLDDVVDGAGDELRDINENYAVDGTQLGVVWEVVPYALFWNQSILDDAGVEPPTDVAELIEASGAIAEETGTTGFTVRHQMNEETPWWTDFSNWVFGHGGAWSDGRELTIDSQENVEALTAFRDVYESDGFGRGQDASTYRAAFSAGELAMGIDNSSAVLTLLGEAVESEQIGSALLPFPSGGSAFAGNAVGINANSPNKEEAKDFLRWMVTQEPQEQLAEALFPSAIATSAEAPDDLVEANPWVAEFFEQVNDSRNVIIEGFEGQTAEIRTIILTQVERTVTEGVSPAEALAQAQSEAEALSS